MNEEVLCFGSEARLVLNATEMRSGVFILRFLLSAGISSNKVL